MSGVYDVTEAFVGLKEAVVIESFNNGVYVDGIWNQSVADQTPSLMVAIPVPSKEASTLDLPGYSGNRVFRFYSEVEVSGANNSLSTPPDKIIYDGHKYVVKIVDDWMHAGGYYLAYGERE